jgi:gluconolactonase
MHRRTLLSAAASNLLPMSASVFGQSFPFTPNQRYPDPALHILDPRFTKYRI